MKVGVLKEIKEKENRVALTPAGAQTLTQAGYSVLVQAGAGDGSGFGDEAYRQAHNWCLPSQPGRRIWY